MASTVEAVPPSVQIENRGSTIQPFRGTRSRDRGGSRGGNRSANARGTQHSEQQFMNQQGGQRGGRQRGRGNRGNNQLTGRNSVGPQLSNSLNQPQPPLDPPPDLGGGGSFGVRLTKDAMKTEGEAGGKERGDEEDNEEVCFICASPVVHNSVAPCNHRTCHICALRLRALYKTRACAHCRSEAQYVIFTDDSSKRYEDYVDADFQKKDEVLGILYEQNEIYDDTLLLLRYNCPDNTCDIACYGWPDLHRHVRNVHHKIMCDLCTRNKKVFTHEHEVFTVQELRKHEKFGDDNPGAVDQSGFKGHPECGFCRQRFYGDDELFAHCRDKHEKCHICDRRLHGRDQRYYVDYDSLEGHFRQDHFLCADRDCLQKKFVVFESEMDLKAHQLQVHPNELSKDARRDARLVDISTFDYRAPYQDNRGRRDRDGRGRGRDPNAEAIPQSTAQPLRRDELAFQRQMAIQSAQSVTARTFGGQLTPGDARPSNRQTPTTVNASRPRPSSVPTFDNVDYDSNLVIDSNSSSTVAPTPQEQARRLQHASVMDRASLLLQNDSSKIPAFRSSVSSYRTSQITASVLIDTFFTLFDVPATDLGKLIKELADIYEDESKRLDLLKAWNDWRAINEDYPSLPGPSGVLPTTAAGSGGHRVLRLKSSTAQSSRSAANKQRSWGNATNANPFPAMSTASANRAGAGRVGATPWIAPSAPTSSRSTSRAAVPSQHSSSSPHSMASNTESAFPALPTAHKPNTLIAGLTRGAVRRDESRTNSGGTNPWGASPSASAGVNTEPEGAKAEDEEERGRKRKGKKQVVYKFG